MTGNPSNRNAGLLMGTSTCNSLLIFKTNLLFVWGPGGTSMQFVDKTAMTITTTLTGTYRALYFRVDNLDATSNTVYALSSASPYGLFKFTMGASTYTMTLSAGLPITEIVT